MKKINIKFFKDINERDKAGGKGQSLAKLSQNGFNVPDGFVILSNEFDRFIKENSIGDEIGTLIKKLNINDEKSLKSTSENICSIIDKAELDSELQNEILHSFSALHSKYVAVRSSALSEDSKENAWAGQLDTFLYIDEKSIIDAIKHSWKSLYNQRALYYGVVNNNIKNNSVAVVVQKMINSDSSGVSFSTNPIKSNEDVIVIEAIDGLGETIVSGKVTPDYYEVKKFDYSINIKQINAQTEKSTLKDKQIQTEKINNDKQKISDNQITKLAKIVADIEKLYGFPVDIEWAIEENIIYILQARPITTEVGDTESVLSKIVNKKNWEFLWLREFAWFVEYTQVHATQKEYQDKFLGFDVATKNRLCINGDEYVLTDDEDYENEKIRAYSANNVDFWKNFIKRDFEIEKETIEYTKNMKNKDFSKLNNIALLEEFKSFNEAYIKSFVPTTIIPEDYIQNEVAKLLKQQGFDEDKIEKIIFDVAKCPDYGKNYYNDEPLDLLKIALKKKNGQSIEKDLKQHIEEYGWLKDPCITEQVSFTKKDYLDRLDTLVTFDVEKRINEIYAVRKENDKSLEIAIKKYGLESKVVEMISALRDFTFLHTYTAENTDHLFYVARRSLLHEIAKRYGIDDTDIVSLSDDEIIQLMSGNASKDTILQHVDARKIGFAIAWIDSKIYTIFGEGANYIAEEVSSKYKRINDDKKSDFEDKSAIDDEQVIITGNVANQGKVRGIAKILFEYEDIKKVNVGDIIVTSMTTPIFVSAMEKAAAFVTDEGGITCHAGIISREFGIPCVVGTVCATKLIKDGDYIEVDAYKGEIKIIE